MDNIGHDPDSLGQEVMALAEAIEPEEMPVLEKALFWRSYPIEVCPYPVRQFIERGAEAMQVDPVFFALPVLVVSAAAIGNTRRVRLRKSWDAPPILWAAVIGKSGTGKSPAMEKVVAPILRKQSDEFTRFQNEQRTFNAGEGETPPQPATRYMVDDVTVEALADRLQDAPRGLLVFRDELAGWVLSFGQYKSTRGGDMQSWLCLHTGIPLTIDRKTGDRRTIHVPQAASCILGGIQPGILQRCFTGEHFDSGLLARILMVYPPAKTRRWAEIELEPETETAWADVVSRMLSIKATEDTLTGELLPGVVELDADAKALFVTYYDRHNEELAHLDCDGERAFFAKLEGGAARLALVIHCLRLACKEIHPERALLMDAKTMQAGITLADWHKAEIQRIYRGLYGEERQQDRQSLLSWLQSHDGQTTARDLRNAHKGRYPTVEDAELALDELVQDGAGTWETHQNPKGGPKSKVFRLNLEVQNDRVM